MRLTLNNHALLRRATGAFACLMCLILIPMVSLAAGTGMSAEADASHFATDLAFYAGAFFLKQSNYGKARDHLSDYISLGNNEERKAAAQEIIDKLDSHDLADTMLYAHVKDVLRAVHIGAPELLHHLTFMREHCGKVENSVELILGKNLLKELFVSDIAFDADESFVLVFAVHKIDVDELMPL